MTNDTDSPQGRNHDAADRIGSVPSDGLDPVVSLDADFAADPHPLYERLRRHRPVTLAQTSHGLRVWLVTRYDDVRAALTDPRLSKDHAGLEQVFSRHGRTAHRRDWARELNAHMLNSDPPDHTRLRQLVSRGFSTSAIAALRPRIEHIATELATTMRPRLTATTPDSTTESVDLLEHFAFPLSITVLCDILGVPNHQLSDVRAWINTISSLHSTSAQRAAATSAAATYLTHLVGDKRAHPGPDMLSTIIGASDDPDRLSPAEAMATVVLLLVAGHETTVNLIGNGTATLLQHPRHLHQLRATPTLIPAAVEELLRLDGPLNLATLRFTTQPITIADTTIDEGEIILLALASANRDPAHYTHPDTLDTHRNPTHLAFGHGIHHCLGATLARTEATIALRVLLHHLPELTLATHPNHLTWRSSTLFRGLTTLPVRLTPHP